MSRERVRLTAAVAVSILCLGTAVTAFWYQDWQYSLPTPRPEGLAQPSLGTRVDLETLIGRQSDGRPVVIHVVNPDCPCSRFNRDHLRTLVRRFGDRVRFVALVQGSDDAPALEQAFAEWDVDIPVVADPGGRKAARLGAYSTPQGVIVGGEGRLYFRGNYNSTRYCADARTEFVRIALEASIAGQALPAMPSDATVAYGCPLPYRRDAIDPDRSEE